MQPVAKDKSDRRTVQLSLEAHRAFSAACEQPPVRRSMFDVTTRLMFWFVRQTDIVKTAITSDVDRGMEAAYADMLRRLADEIDPPPTYTTPVDHMQDPTIVSRERLATMASEQNGPNLIETGTDGVTRIVPTSGERRPKRASGGRPADRGRDG